MMQVLCFYQKNCPYCLQAKKAMDELLDENPQYQKIKIEWIEENENSDIIDDYDYNATPSMFVGQQKIYESHLFETYEECKNHVKEVLEKVIQEEKDENSLCL